MDALYFYLFLLLVHPMLSQWWKVFAKSNHKSWEAFVPIYNYCVASKIGGLPFWYGVLMIFPGVHIIMYFVFNVALSRRFGMFDAKETAFAIFLPWLNFTKISSSDEIQVQEETNWTNQKEVAHRTPGDHLTLFLSLPVAGHILAYTLGAVFKPAKGKSAVRDWTETVIFALVAASIIRTYVFEPFKIPTGSMEKTLLIGDFLFVNKLAYGPKVPNTPLSFPLFHNNIPWLDVPSYSRLETLKYKRLPGWSDINRYDVVVFNYPSGDTAILDTRMPMGLMGHDYHGIVIDEAVRLYEEQNSTKKPDVQKVFASVAKKYGADMTPEQQDSLLRTRESEIMALYFDLENAFYKDLLENLEVWKNKARQEIAVNKLTFSRNEGMFIKHKGIIYRPVDKRENYIKRCVGIPGDTLEIINAQLYVNGEKAPIFGRQNLGYFGEGIPMMSEQQMEEKFGLVANLDYYQVNGGYVLYITEDEKKQILIAFPQAKLSLLGVGNVVQEQSTAQKTLSNLRCYPKSVEVQNTTENFQKFWIPKKGATIPLTKENLIWYGRVITAYERHSLEQKNGKVFIDGKEADSYTFEMNYYWMMGDNRYQSADSRMWGFVPEDHIVGRAAIVWLSTDQRGSFPMNIRWNRVFTKIK